MNDQDVTLYADTMRTFLQMHRGLRRHGRRMHLKGMSGRKISVLRYLLDAGARTVGELSEYFYVTDSSASEMVAHLERAGYVTRTRSQRDNRVVLVELTSAGREFARQAPLAGIPLLRERLQELPPERVLVIHDVLNQLVQLLGIDAGDDEDEHAGGRHNTHHRRHGGRRRKRDHREQDGKG
jgi:DNA-binding MarR family transcriptional regulator